jgi:hypothetical protein
MATRRNVKNTDYTLNYLKFLAGFRSSAPSAYAFGLTAEQARVKRTEVDICLKSGRMKEVA